MFLCAARILVQKIIRFGVTLPLADRVFYVLTKYAVAVFRRLCSDDPVITTYDDNIKIALRMTKLLEAIIYFQGVDTKDRDEVALLKTLIRPDSTVLDVGGNVGQIALLAAKRAPQGGVHVFEPFADNYQQLLRNLALNGFTNVFPNNNAVSSQSGQITLYAPRTYNTGAISSYPDAQWNADTETVDTVRLDDYVQEHAVAHVDIMKLDVEGAEMDVLEGSERILREHRPDVLMEVTMRILRRANRSSQDILDFWQQFNYRIYRIHVGGQLIPVVTTNDFTPDQNLYCCPSERAPQPI